MYTFLGSLLFISSFSSLAVARSQSTNNDTAVVLQHVLDNLNSTFREPAGELIFPYQVPAGPYNELWDWDSVFIGVLTADILDEPRYFIGSMMNFLHNVNLTNGNVSGCITVNGPTPTLYHAKPILIQGAYLAAKASNNYTQFLPYKPAMVALLSYWESSIRKDPQSSLHQWYNQLETGADNLVYSVCPSAYSPECWSDSDVYTLSSPDIEIFLMREYIAYANFLEKWNNTNSPSTLTVTPEDVLVYRQEARMISDRIDQYMFIWENAEHSKGYYGAYNTSTQTVITNRTYQAAWPIWNPLGNLTLQQASIASLLEPDLFCEYGIRSTSSLDPRYANDNIIDPYSEWRGPLWINVNAILAYSLNRLGYTKEATTIADNVVHVLADDIRNTGVWHECYSTQNGTGLAAAGFLSWNTLGATLQRNLLYNIDPFSLD